MKISVTAEMLKDLGNRAMEIGTERKFIPIALEWIESANKEIHKLNVFIAEEERKRKEVG